MREFVKEIIKQLNETPEDFRFEGYGSLLTNKKIEYHLWISPWFMAVELYIKNNGKLVGIELSYQERKVFKKAFNRNKKFFDKIQENEILNSVMGVKNER